MPVVNDSKSYITIALRWFSRHAELPSRQTIGIKISNIMHVVLVWVVHGCNLATDNTLWPAELPPSAIWFVHFKIPLHNAHLLLSCHRE